MPSDIPFVSQDAAAIITLGLSCASSFPSDPPLSSFPRNTHCTTLPQPWVSAIYFTCFAAPGTELNTGDKGAKKGQELIGQSGSGLHADTQCF
jgi:hypothetical protein